MDTMPTFDLPQSNNANDPLATANSSVNNSGLQQPIAGQDQTFTPPAHDQHPQDMTAQGIVPLSNPTPAAEDVDLIEKEWVVRAKQIVEQTKFDPFVQNKELAKMKAEYIKSRYKKDIKLVDE